MGVHRIPVVFDVAEFDFASVMVVVIDVNGRFRHSRDRRFLKASSRYWFRIRNKLQTTY